MTTKSPSAAGRSTVSSRPARSRSRSISSSTCSSVPAGREPLVLARGGGRAHADLDAEVERLALAGQLAHVELGLADGNDRGVVDRGGVPGADRVAHRL